MKRLAASASLVLVALVLSVTLLTGCGSPGGGSKALEAREWEITKIGNAPYAGLAQATVKFSTGKVIGSVGGDAFSGTYSAGSGGSVTITLNPKAPAAGAPKAEAGFLKALASAASFAADDDSLTLFDSSGVAALTCEAVTAKPLVATAWRLTKYGDGKGGLVSAVQSATVSAMFGADGSLRGNGGVNDYRSTYLTTGSAIKITAGASTKKSGSADLMAQESAYLSALPSVATYAIEGSTLTLRNGQSVAVAQFVAR